MVPRHGPGRGEGLTPSALANVEAVAAPRPVRAPPPAPQAAKHKAFIRFEHPRPNGLWQMDFKGHVEMRAGGRCHPLSVLDDHSRFALCIAACANEQTQTVQAG